MERGEESEREEKVDEEVEGEGQRARKCERERDGNATMKMAGIDASRSIACFW